MNSFIVTIFLNTLYGLFLCRFKNRREKFVFSKPVAIYCVVVASAFAAFYVRNIYENYINGLLKMRDTVLLYLDMNVGLCLINYVTQWAMTWEVTAFQKTIPIIETLNSFNMDMASIWRIFIVSAIKMWGFPVVVGVVLILQQGRSSLTFSVMRASQTLFPLIVGNQLNNSFFGSVVVAKVVLTACNKELRKVLLEVNMMQTPLQMRLNKPYYRMKRFCELADYLDDLALRYTIAITRSMDYLRLTALSLICSLLINLVGFTVGFFNQYQAIADHFINGKPYDLIYEFTHFVFLLVPFLEIALLARVSNSVVEDTLETGNLLQRFDLQYADVRFRQVVETFWLQQRTIKYKLLPLGVIELNVGLVTKMMSAVTSFLLILIQTDLTLKFSK
ncbi:putative gustatory receptor 97a [Scaptodrosophila lebanonensis]|uniref:Gustatory receptor n=1 Tax=Drosophila lebanonensis TaxID=7225 RepID=A0A6J2T0J8_DROLE|nr:putative gustatory receptor 97a [Scaptodrosophila lebanonensis]